MRFAFRVPFLRRQVVKHSTKAHAALPVRFAGLADNRHSLGGDSSRRRVVILKYSETPEVPDIGTLNKHAWTISMNICFAKLHLTDLNARFTRRRAVWILGASFAGLLGQLVPLVAGSK